MRRVFRRRLEQAGHHGGLGKRDVLHRLAEVVVRRGRDPERAAAHVGAVEVELEDLALGQVELEPDGEEGLLDLALEGALVREEQVLGELLRDGRPALHHAAAARVDGERPRGADRVDAPVLEEAPVLSGERRLDEIVGHFVELDRIVVLDAASPDLGAVAIKEGDGEVLALEPVLAGLVERGLSQGQHDDGAGDPNGRGLAGDLEDHARRAADAQLRHQLGVAAPAVRGAPGALEQGRVDP